MGTFLIALGIILFAGLTGGGALFVNKLSGYTLKSGQTALEFMGVHNPAMVYIVVVGICAIIGLLIGISYIMLGMNTNRIADMDEEIYSLRKALKKSSSKKQPKE